MISYLCKISGVSRFGFYKYFSEESIATRKARTEKDEIIRENVLKAFNFKNCHSLDDVKKEIDEYMDYYNNYRYQWNLNKMISTQYRDHLSAA